MFTSLTFEGMFQIVLAGEGLLVLILQFDHLKHTIIDLARLSQASHEQAGLFLLQVQSVLKCFHVLYIVHEKIDGNRLDRLRTGGNSSP